MEGGFDSRCTPGCGRTSGSPRSPLSCRAAALPCSPGRSCLEPATCKGLKVSPTPGRFFTTHFSPFWPEKPSCTQGSFWREQFRLVKYLKCDKPPLPENSLLPWGLRLRWQKTLPLAKTLQNRVRSCHLVALWRPVTVTVTVSSRMPHQPGRLQR